MVGTGKLSSHAEGLKSRIVGNSAAALWALLGAALVVLLIAGANLANLVLVRGDSREKEVLLRQTLGAGGGDLTRFFLSESLLIAMVGAMFGLALAYAAVTALTRYVPIELPRPYEVRVDGLAVAFLFLATLVCSVTFSVPPLLRHLSRKGAASPQMKLATTVGIGPSRWRHVLVVTQVSLAVVLLAAAGLMVQSFKHLSAVDAGFSADSRLTFTVGLSRREYRSGMQAATFHMKPWPGCTLAMMIRLESRCGHSATTILNGSRSWALFQIR